MRHVAVITAAMAMVAGLAAPASAQPGGSAIVEVHKEPFEYAFVDSELCDFDIEVVGSGQMNLRIREGRNNREQAFFVHNTFSFSETLSANGQYVTVTARQTFNEVRALPLGDGVFQFHDVLAGRLAIRDADGRRLGHEAGVIRGTYAFDTLNDDQPGGELIGDIEETLHGRFGDVDLICAALEP